MLEFELKGAKKLLFLGAHSDDIEIGCGGTILTLAKANRNWTFLWVVFSAEGSGGREARSSARRFLKGVKGATVVVKQFRPVISRPRWIGLKDTSSRLSHLHRTSSLPIIARIVTRTIASFLTWRGTRFGII